MSELKIHCRACFHALVADSSIDFVHLTASSLHAPAATFSIIREETRTVDRISSGSGVWPSDHRAVLVTLKISGRPASKGAGGVDTKGAASASARERAAAAALGQIEEYLAAHGPVGVALDFRRKEE